MSDSVLLSPKKVYCPECEQITAIFLDGLFHCKHCFKDAHWYNLLAVEGVEVYKNEIWFVNIRDDQSRVTFQNNTFIFKTFAPTSLRGLIKTLKERYGVESEVIQDGGLDDVQNSCPVCRGELVYSGNPRMNSITCKAKPEHFMVQNALYYFSGALKKEYQSRTVLFGWELSNESNRISITTTDTNRFLKKKGIPFFRAAEYQEDIKIKKYYLDFRTSSEEPETLVITVPKSLQEKLKSIKYYLKKCLNNDKIRVVLVNS